MRICFVIIYSDNNKEINTKSYTSIYIIDLDIWFNEISILVGYLMLIHFLEFITEKK